MVLVVSVLVLAAVFAIAAVAVGREARRLGHEAPRAVIDLDEATEFVARHVPFEVSAQLSYDEVRQLLRWHLDYLKRRGVVANGDSALGSGEPVVVGGIETVDHLVRRAATAGFDLTAVQAQAVVDAQMTYLQSIGAIGPERPA